MIKNKNIIIEFDANNKINAYYDEDRIIQVVTNLLSNAIKFCPESEGKITITIESKEDRIHTSIKDNGKGINSNDFEAIFEKFYQSNNQNIKKPEGSGLGLAICKQIIGHHKGTIWVEPSEIGAQIIFTLPIKSE